MDENVLLKMIDNNNRVRIEGCGCRFRRDISSNGHSIGIVEECEHLCDNHKNEFILEKYNEHVLWKIMMESDALAMDAMNKEMKELEKSCNGCYENHKLGFKITNCFCSCHGKNRR